MDIYKIYFFQGSYNAETLCGCSTRTPLESPLLGYFLSYLESTFCKTELHTFSKTSLNSFMDQPPLGFVSITSYFYTEYVNSFNLLFTIRS